MSKGLDRSALLKELKSAFPELKDEINAEQGLLAFELEVFYRFTQKMINAGDEKTVLACFTLAEKYYLSGNFKIKDAIDTCYVENLDFSNTKRCDRRWAWAKFPEALKKLHNDFHSGSMK